MFDKSLYQEACQLRDGVNEIVKQIADHKNAVSRMQLQITALEPWMGLDLDLSLGRTQSCELL